MAKSKKNDKKHHGGHHAPPPKEKVVVKKKRGGCLMALILLILLILLALFLLKHLGLFGFGDGKEKGDDSGNTPGTTQSEIEKNDAEIRANVTVMGHEYVFNNDKIELEELINELKALEGKLTVYISDSNAVDKAMNDLKDRLDGEKFSYMEVVQDETDEPSSEA